MEPAHLRERDAAARHDRAGGVRVRIGTVLAQERGRALQRVRRVECGRHPDLAPLLHLVGAAAACGAQRYRDEGLGFRLVGMTQTIVPAQRQTMYLKSIT